MPRPLESGFYKQIEWNLHNVAMLREADKDATDAILHGSASKDPGSPSGTSKHSDSTAVKAIALLETVPHLWLEVIGSTYAYYKNAPEARMATLFYEDKMPLNTVAAVMDCSRRMVMYYRDNFVMRCGMLAAETGLLKLTKGRR